MSDLEITDREEKYVWKWMGIRSARQMAEELGVSPERIMQIKRSLIESVDILTIQEMRVKLLSNLQDIARRTQNDYDNAPMEFKAGIMNSSIAAMKTVLAELARAEKTDTSKVESLNQLRVKELVSLIQETVDVSVEQVAEKYDLDKEVLFAIFNENLTKAAQRREVES